MGSCSKTEIKREKESSREREGVLCMREGDYELASQSTDAQTDPPLAELTPLSREEDIPEEIDNVLLIYTSSGFSSLLYYFRFFFFFFLVPAAVVLFSLSIAAARA